MNPFEGNDNEEPVECSSGDEITRIFELDDENLFNFEEWITEYGLQDIKECFKDHDMITLDTLNMNNTKFRKLMADQRVLIKAHLIQNIVNGIQTLIPLRQKIKQKQAQENDEKEGDFAESQTTTTEPRLIFMSQKENEIFTMMEKYIKNLTNLRNDLMIATQEDFETARDANLDQIELYQEAHLPKLDEMEQKIQKTFELLHESVNNTKQMLEHKADKFANEIKDIKTSQTRIMDVIDGKYKHCMSIIDNDNTLFNESIVKCKDIVKQYDDECITDDLNNDAFSFKNINKKRQQEIIDIGNDLTKKYCQTMLLLDDEQNEINNYIRAELNLSKNDMYQVSVDNNLYKEINDGLDILLHVNDDPQKKRINEARKMKLQKYTENVNKKEEEVEDDDDDDELYCVEFKIRPFGFTLRPGENKKNLFVTTIDENSVAFNANVRIGCKVVQLQNERIEDVGSVEIFKLLNNKYGKVLPLNITFKKANEAQDIKFDRFNEEKWELDDAESSKTIRGIDYDPAKMYCVYFGGDGYKKGVHYLTVKCTKLNDEEVNIKCCIGVTSENNDDWMMNGIQTSWPQIGSCSYFNGWSDEPYWYSSESITVKLDVNKLMVYYFTVHESKRKLIKKENIKQAEMYYFMMCSDCDPTVQYTIK